MSLTRFILKEICTIITIIGLTYTYLTLLIIRVICLTIFYLSIYIIFTLPIRILDIITIIICEIIVWLADIITYPFKTVTIHINIWYFIKLILIQMVIFIISSHVYLKWYYDISTVNESFIPSVICLANIKQNRLSLKSLEQKLAKLEKSDSHRKDDNSNNKDSENIIVRIRKGSVIDIKHCTDLR